MSQPDWQRALTDLMEVWTCLTCCPSGQLAGTDDGAGLNVVDLSAKGAARRQPLLGLWGPGHGTGSFRPCALLCGLTTTLAWSGHQRRAFHT